MQVHNQELKARRQGLSGSDGSGTNAADDRAEATGANVGNPDAADEESPSREFDDSLYEPLGNKVRGNLCCWAVLPSDLGCCV